MTFYYVKNLTIMTFYYVKNLTIKSFEATDYNDALKWSGEHDNKEFFRDPPKATPG